MPSKPARFRDVPPRPTRSPPRSTTQDDPPGPKAPLAGCEASDRWSEWAYGASAAAKEPMSKWVPKRKARSRPADRAARAPYAGLET